MMPLRYYSGFSSNAPTSRLDMYIKLIFSRGLVSELCQPSAWTPPKVGRRGHMWQERRLPVNVSHCPPSGSDK